MSDFLKKAFTNENWSSIIANYERVAEPCVAHWVADVLHLAHNKIANTVSREKEGDKSQSTTFVDVGCGTGALALAFAEKYLGESSADANASKVRIIATDLADGMLARLDEKLDTTKRYEQFRPHIQTIQMDGQLLAELDDNSVDIVGSNYGLSIFPDRVKAWNSSARVLKDGGLLFATAWDVESPNLRWVDAFATLAHAAQAAKDDASASPPLFLPSSKVGTTHDQIANELLAAGFRDVETYRTQHTVVNETPALLVETMLSNPGASGFADHTGRERLEDALYDFAFQEGGFPLCTSGRPSRAELKTYVQPVTFEFIGYVVVATK